MRYAASETLGTVTGPDGKHYDLEFYGEDEGAAVVSGPLRIGGSGGLAVEGAEVHREPASSPEDARTKLKAWMRSMRWTG